MSKEQLAGLEHIWVENQPLSEADPISARVFSYGEAGQGPWRHIHYALEMGVVLRGRTRRWCSNRQLDLEPGQVWFCGIWEPHGWQTLTAPCGRLILEIWPPLLPKVFFPEAPDLNWTAPFVLPADMRPQVTDAERQRVKQLAERITAAAEVTDQTRPVRLRLLALELLLPLVKDQAAPIRSADTASAYRSVTPALEMVSESRRRISNEEAARACGLGCRRFIRTFRRLMGLRFAKFALRHRLQSAAHELRVTDSPIKAIARKWGFVDESHLSRLFVQHYGCPPGRYRLGFRRESS